MNVPRHFSTHRIVCWRVSRHCNRACPFCLSRSGPRIAHPDRDPVAVVTRLRALGTEKISYSGGEPLAYPQLPELVLHAERLGLKQLLTTNGDLLGDVPSWFGSLEYVKLSFYGDGALHDSLMGPGHFDLQLDAARRLVQRGIVVSANYMLTPRSLAVAPAFMGHALGAGMHDVMFQTYISNGRRHVDATNRLDDHRAAVTALRRTVGRTACELPGGAKIHDYSKRDWFVVLDERDRLTLPASDGSPDFLMGDVGQQCLRLPRRPGLPAAAALEWVWSRRRETDAIIDLTGAERVA